MTHSILETDGVHGSRSPKHILPSTVVFDKAPYSFLQG